MKHMKWIIAWVGLPILLAVLFAARTPPVQAALPPPAAYLPWIASSPVLPPADAAAARLTVPPGFAIRVYALLSSRPRLLTVGPDGQLYAAMYDAGQIIRLPDRDGNGLSDPQEVVASGLTFPHNVEFRNGFMYVAETGRVDRLADLNGDGVYETRTLITNNIPGTGGHTSRTLHFGPDGMLYVSAGSSCNICVETDPRRAAILRFTPDGGIPADNPFANDPDPLKRPVYAYGLRNSVDFLFHPQSGALWADHNGSDGLGDNVPPEEAIISVQAGQSHGWPYCYTPTLGLNSAAEVADTRMTPPQGFSCASVVPALFTVPAHSAPLGMAWGPPAGFPAAYRDSVYIALHGSWNTSDPANFRDCKIERIILQNGQVVGSETFVNGFREPGKLCGDPITWGRPAGIAFDAHGTMFISDDKANRIYRLVYTGP